MAAPRRTPSIFWPIFWLGIALLGTKIHRVYLPTYFAYAEFNRYFLEVAMVAAADLVFTLAVGLLAKGLMLLTARRPRLQTFLRRALLGFCGACVFYAVLSMRLYDVLHMPLTYQLLRIGGDLSNLRSSVGAAIDPVFLLLLVLLPFAHLALTLLSEHHWSLPQSLRVRAGQACGACGILVFGMLGHNHVNSEWGRRYHMPKIWDSPHYDLVRSSVAELFHSDPAGFEDVDLANLPADFHSAPALPPAAGLAGRPKNLIVIVGESVGAHYLSLYGSPLKTSPNLEAEAASSLVFDNYYSHVENTSCALFAITLSRYAPLTWNNATSVQPRAPGISAAQVLKQHGFRTVFLSGGDNSYAGQDEFLAQRGFDVIKDSRDAAGAKAFSWGMDDKTTFDMILKQVDEDPSKPFYIFAWNQATHHPFYLPPDQKKVDFINGNAALSDIPEDLNNHLNAIAELDRQMARLFEGLRQRGLADQTAVVFTGDHGQAFGPPHHGYFHSGYVYQEDVRVPLMIWSPAMFKHAARSETIGAHVDLSPTLLDLVGVASPEGWMGHSLLQPGLVGERRAYFFGMRNDYIFGVREGPFKYIYNSTQGTNELFNLEKDPTEQHNLSPGEPELRRRLHQLLGAWIASQKQPATEPPAILSTSAAAPGIKTVSK